MGVDDVPTVCDRKDAKWNKAPNKASLQESENISTASRGMRSKAENS